MMNFFIKRFNFNKLENLNQLSSKYIKNKQYRLAKDILKTQLINVKDNFEKEFNLNIELAFCNKKLGLFKESQDLYELLLDKSKNLNNDQYIEDSFMYLLKHCIKYNLNRALDLGESFNINDIKQNENFKNKLEIYLGLSFLWDGDIIKSKKFLFNNISKGLDDNLSAIALNNFANACWWHKHPNYLDFDPVFEEEESEDDEKEFNEKVKKSKDEDFSFVIPIFKNSIYFFEKQVNEKNIDKVLEFLQIEKTLSLDFFYYKDKDIFKNPYSGLVMLNLAEFLLSNHKEMNVEGFFYWMNALKILEKDNLHGMYERGLSILAMVYEGDKNYILSEKLFQKAIEINKMNKSWNKTPLIYTLKNYGKFLQKIPEKLSLGKNYLSLSYELEDKQDFWHKKLVHLVIPN